MLGVQRGRTSPLPPPFQSRSPHRTPLPPHSPLPPLAIYHLLAAFPILRRDFETVDPLSLTTRAPTETPFQILLTSISFNGHSLLSTPQSNPGTIFVSEGRCNMIPDGLPIELEREIFGIAALQCPRAIPTLLQVACRVRTWIEPLMYRVLSFTGDKLSHGPETLVPKPDSVFLQGVRSLLLYQSVDIEDMLVILRICVKISNLAVYNETWTFRFAPTSPQCP
ncbi:hypothetical protein B0H13DRAFT_2390819 [Mycena leptocephala]|nr:hypothetical protein B0H13DRAFT_2390819 [Mycena leptocephala]